MNSNLSLLVRKTLKLLAEHKNIVFLLMLVFLLFAFALVTFKTSTIDKPEVRIKQYSYLYLQEFISGYRTESYDFESERVRFGPDFLTFTLLLDFNPPTSIVVKKLGMDMLIGLREEYPELDLIRIKITNRSGAVIYGYAEFEDNTLRWNQ